MGNKSNRPTISFFPSFVQFEDRPISFSFHRPRLLLFLFLFFSTVNACKKGTGFSWMEVADWCHWISRACTFPWRGQKKLYDHVFTSISYSFARLFSTRRRGPWQFNEWNLNFLAARSGSTTHVRASSIGTTWISFLSSRIKREQWDPDRCWTRNKGRSGEIGSKMNLLPGSSVILSLWG